MLIFTSEVCIVSPQIQPHRQKLGTSSLWSERKEEYLPAPGRHSRTPGAGAGRGLLQPSQTKELFRSLRLRKEEIKLPLFVSDEGLPGKLKRISDKLIQMMNEFINVSGKSNALLTHRRESKTTTQEHIAIRRRKIKHAGECNKKCARPRRGKRQKQMWDHVLGMDPEERTSRRELCRQELLALLVDWPETLGCTPR